MAIDLDWKGADRLLKQVLQILPREAAQALDGLNAAQVEEIRLRCGQVPSILRRGVEQPLPHCERTPQQELQRTLLAASAQSQYAVQEQLREGFLSVPGGVRIGVCGSAVVQDGRVTGIREISSLCIRIPHEIRHPPEQLLPLLSASRLLAGRPGSGKTTLLRCLNFLTVPDEGQIAVNGETLFDAADPNTQKESEIRRKRLHFGLVFQNFNLFPQYTARQNVMLASELLAKEQPDYKARKKQIHAQIAAHAEELLTQVGLKEKMDLYPHQLSGGQQQRVAIARALALQPDILCFDEPTSALDPELTGEVLKVIRSLSEQHMTMIIVTHEMAFARDVADRVIFMDGGVIVEQGPAHDVIENPQAERTRQFLARYRENQ